MDHTEATQLGAVEKYLLDELSPELRDQFEEHYFDCQECATDLRATTAFIEAAKREFTARPVARVSAPASNKRLFQWPAILTPALAASLLVIGYQNVIVYPHMEGQLARLEAPAILPTLSLVSSNSRGGPAASITVKDGAPYLVSFDIPAQASYAGYTCQLYTHGGVLAWQIQISSQAAKDTVTISAPAGDRPAGAYTLVIQGNSGPSSTGVEIVRYHFNLVVTQ